MKIRLFFSVLTAIVLALLLTGGVGAYWLAAHRLDRPVQTESIGPASQFVSRQSPLVISLLVNPDRLTTQELSDTPASQRQQVQAQWRQFRQQLLSPTNLNYSRDLQPWLGDQLTFAVTAEDIDRDLNNGRQPGYLVVAAVRTPERADQSLQAYWQRQAGAGVDLVFEQYAGVNLIYGRRDRRPQRSDESPADRDLMEPGLTTATVGNQFVLFANHPKVLRDAVNNLQVPELSLSNSEAYQQALQQLTLPQVATVYLNLPQLTTWLDLTTPSAEGATSPLFDRLVLGLQPQSQGWLADALLLAKADQAIEPASPPTLSQPVAALRYIPATSSWVASGKNLLGLWQQLEPELTFTEPLRQPLQTLSQHWQIPAEELFALVSGPYALSFLPQPTGVLDWVLATEHSEDSSTLLATLDQQARSHGTTPSTFTLGEQAVTAWTKLSTVMSPAKSSPPRQRVTVTADVEGVYTTIGESDIVASSLDAMSQALNATETSLLNNESFQHALDSLSVPNNGYLYLDRPILQALLQSVDLPSALTPLRSVLDRVQSATVSSYGSMANIQRAGIDLRITE